MYHKQTRDIPLVWSKNEHNKVVKKNIVDELVLNKQNTYSKTLIESKY